jgi:hypothetical protein
VVLSGGPISRLTCVGPNDELAKEILDFAHHMYLLTLDHKLHLAPIKQPQVGGRILAPLEPAG